MPIVQCEIGKTNGKCKRSERKDTNINNLKKNQNIDVPLVECQNIIQTPETQSPVLQSIIRVDKQSTVNPNARRFVEEDQDRAVYSKLLSAAEYRVRCQNMTCIHERTVSRRKAILLKMHLKNRTLVGYGEGQLKIDLETYRKRQGLSENQIIHCITQVDACAMASNPKFGHNNKLINIEIITKKDGTKVVKPLVYAYAFYMVPLDPQYKPELLYMLLSSQGIGNKQVIPTYEKIKEIVQNQVILLIFSS
ncbi:Hypothetical_protein [Hexamita inflata]|uniref:Hypothetical_protein n=1 Tax=Hexamita inflata TaxID=28002 RepID=A0AA86QLP7_9EUKA|nr:Hypothetical protein HINF_LOCUS41695 [Hexamita inflata]